MPLDRLDVQILNLLQTDASLPLRELAERVHSSTATVQRRLAQLRTDGYLVKQVVLLNRQLVGKVLTIFVSVEIETQNESMLRAFEKQMQNEHDVMACYEVSGEFDFMLIVTASSMEAYHGFTRRVFTSANNVRNFKSNFAMNCSKFETRINLEEPQ
ncbi:DNA-binding transcriptional activator DecR [bioreactor metagenome]|uniref:DNA-binding transcriptional activator DecR n=1 Tax=bioreactor metagenome TaxID=1076179 RepID=A0A645EVV3_9ZZZZ